MDPGLERLRALPVEQATAELRACCAATDWVTAVASGLPHYEDRAELLRDSAAALDGLDWDGVAQALAAHPRIGERVAADNREAAWSATEQSGMRGSSGSTREALEAANRAYERRFGHVFLIFATGRTDVEMLAEARKRLHHDIAVEQATVRVELAKIVQLRLTKLLDGR